MSTTVERIADELLETIERLRGEVNQQRIRAQRAEEREYEEQARRIEAEERAARAVEYAEFALKKRDVMRRELGMQIGYLVKRENSLCTLALLFGAYVDQPASRRGQR